VLPPDPAAASPSSEPDPVRQDSAILIEVDEEFAAEVDAAALSAAICATLIAEQHAADSVTLVVTSDEAVADLNREYRGMDGPTDVLSFPAQEPTPGFVSAPEMVGYLGDIVIALPYTRRQAEELGRALDDELRLLAIHGALHLLGYDHGTPAEEATMWAQQDAILAQLGRAAS
jgi:probable rRNA maturation factor